MIMICANAKHCGAKRCCHRQAHAEDDGCEPELCSHLNIVVGCVQASEEEIGEYRHRIHKVMRGDR